MMMHILIHERAAACVLRIQIIRTHVKVSCNISGVSSYIEIGKFTFENRESCHDCLRELAVTIVSAQPKKE
jgi:hypothetical protein